jgi:hypothetical protein
MNYSSVITIESSVLSGVRFSIRRVSLGARLELLHRVRELTLKSAFYEAGKSTEDRIQASISAYELARLYLAWGVVGIDGLNIDGKAATVETLIAEGPEALCDEIVEHIRGQLQLSADERKN